ncbi:MAG: hypothetical protein ACRERV_10460 [Methylococcales bacterium]
MNKRHASTEYADARATNGSIRRRMAGQIYAQNLSPSAGMIAISCSSI